MMRAGDDGDMAIFSVDDGSSVLVGEILGSGTLANVYAAEWLGLDVAIKQLRLPDEITDECTRGHALTDFLNERKTNLTLMQSGYHPNIVAFFGVCDGTIGNRFSYPAAAPSLVFECVDGGLLDVRKYGGGSKMKRTVSVALCIARALAHAHRNGIMHRDVKPSNVLMVNPEVAKLADWGLSTRIDDDGKSPDTGTAEYMAPEVFLGQGCYDEKADVFSFAVLMYCLGARTKSPYEANYITAQQAVQAVAHRGLRPTISSSFGLEVGYVELMRICWSEDPSERPSMAAVAMKLYTLWKSLCAEEKNNSESKQSWSSWLGL